VWADGKKMEISEEMRLRAPKDAGGLREEQEKVSGPWS